MAISRLDFVVRNAGLLYRSGTSPRLIDDFFLTLSAPERSVFAARYSSTDARATFVRDLYERSCTLLTSSLPADLDADLVGEDSVRTICTTVMRYLYRTEMERAA